MWYSKEDFQYYVLAVQACHATFVSIVSLLVAVPVLSGSLRGMALLEPGAGLVGGTWGARHYWSFAEEETLGSVFHFRRERESVSGPNPQEPCRTGLCSQYNVQVLDCLAPSSCFVVATCPSSLLGAYVLLVPAVAAPCFALQLACCCPHLPFSFYMFLLPNSHFIPLPVYCVLFWNAPFGGLLAKNSTRMNPDWKLSCSYRWGTFSQECLGHFKQ